MSLSERSTMCQLFLGFKSLSIIYTVWKGFILVLLGISVCEIVAEKLYDLLHNIPFPLEVCSSNNLASII